MQMHCEILKQASPFIHGTGTGMRRVSPFLLRPHTSPRAKREGLMPVRTVSGSWLCCFSS